MRIFDIENIENVAVGAAVLGTGGGGDPYIGKLMAIQAIRECGPIQLLDLSEIKDDDLIGVAAMMGAPTVMVEKLPSGDEIVNAFRTLENYLGRKINVIMSAEAGGLNSTVPFALAARVGLPVVDADGMGRAFPELQMITFTLYGVAATPLAIADEKGNCAVISTINNKWTEQLARSLTIDMGSSAMIAGFTISGKLLREAAIPATITLAETIGATIREARRNSTDPVATVLKVSNGFQLFKGKISDIERRTETGFARGEATLDGIGEDQGSTLKIRFQNEFLTAVKDGEVLATVPDLITILDAETGEPITTESLRYGFRVVVMAMPCNEKWRTPAGIELVGPRYFGYDLDYIPVEELEAQRKAK
jgi:DUF917 family protein